MDLSEFKPPVRLSMSDEEIYQALGSAQASEDGIAKAMAIVEEQANLREHDNKLFSEWVARMQHSPAPEARIALENVERAKQGLEPLPLSAPVADVAAALNAAHVESVSAPEVEEVPELESIVDPESPEVSEEPEVPEELEEPEEQLESIFANLTNQPAEELPEPVEAATPTYEVVVEVPGLDEPVDDFEQLLSDAASEATTSISVTDPAVESAVTFETDEPEVLNFEVSADEDALVAEESQKVVKSSGWWSNGAFWTLASGVFVPVIAAYLAVSAGLTFGSAMLGFTLGLLVNLGLIVSAHFTAQRTGEPNVVTSRATFGVFGAFIPGLFGLAFAVVILNLSAIGITSSFDGVFDVGVNFGDSLLSSVTIGSALSIALVVVAYVIAGFAQRAVKWINTVAAALLVLAFVVAGLITRDQLTFDTMDLNIDWGSVFLIAGSVVTVGIATYGKAPKVTPSKSTSRTLARWSAIGGTAFVLPAAAFAHFALVFEQANPGSGFAMLAPLGLTTQPALATPVLWVTAFALVALLINLGSQALGQLRAFGINQIRGWFAIVASLTATSLWLLPEWSIWLDLLQLLVIPLAAGVGFGFADSIIRRGLYHEASLLRGYGFYGKFNLLAVLGYLVIVAFGLSVSQATVLAPWLGFAGWTTPLAPIATFGLAAVWSAATGIPRILVQQREVAEVESRKASLTQFTGFTE